jgi:hypothetical protein
MLLLCRRDQDHDLVHRHQDVVDHQLLVRQLMDHLNDKDLHLVRHQYAVGNYLDRLYLQDVVYLVAPQNQDAQNQDAVLTFQGARQLNRRDVVVDAEPRFQLKMDCYPDAVDAERYLFQLNQRLKMDCYPDEGS